MYISFSVGGKGIADALSELNQNYFHLQEHYSRDDV